MSEYATHGALLTCSAGMAPTPLEVTSHTSTEVQDKAVATVADKVPNVNIKPFGTCKLKPTFFGFAPCVPAPTAWVGAQPTVQIAGGNPLLMTSKIPCACGGMISFENSGQMKPNKVKINATSPQIEALKQAAITANPFCEECKKDEIKEEIKIINVYWIDETDHQVKRLSELDQNKEVTLFVGLEGAEVGDTIDFTIEAPEGSTYEGGKTELSLSTKVEANENGYIGIIENFSYKFE